MTTMTKQETKGLSSTQAHFLGDRLQLEAYEKSAAESPLKFLQDFAIAFKRKVPFNVAFAQVAFKRHGKVKEYNSIYAYRPL